MSDCPLKDRQTISSGGHQAWRLPPAFPAVSLSLSLRQPVVRYLAVISRTDREESDRRYRDTESLFRRRFTFLARFARARGGGGGMSEAEVLEASWGPTNLALCLT